jgi:hypothetical protein
LFPHSAAAKLFGEKSAPAAVTLGFITLWWVADAAD